MAAMPQREASAPGSGGQRAGRGQLGARRGVPLSLRNTPSPGSPPGPGKGPAPQPTHREPEAAVPQMGVESFAGDAGFHHHREVFGIQLQDSVHTGQVDTNATLAGGIQRIADLGLPPGGPQLVAPSRRTGAPAWQVRGAARRSCDMCDRRTWPAEEAARHAYLDRADSTLQAGACAEGDDGNALAVAQGCQLADLLHVLGPHHGVRRLAPATRPSECRVCAPLRSCSCL